jgi:HEAT repeat protein
LRSLFACGVLVASIGACDSPPTPAPTSFVNLDSLVKAANGDPGVWPRVATALIHGDSMAAVHAAELLAHAGPAALPAIRRLLRELDPRSQRLGAYALGSLGPAGAPALRDLIPLLGGADSTVANMADWSLSRIAPAREPPLLSLARDLRYGDDGVRLDAALNLKQVTDDVEPVCPLLVQRLADPSPAVRGAAFAVLEKAGATVLRCLQQPRPDADPEIRAAVRLLRIRVEGGGLGN